MPLRGPACCKRRNGFGSALRKCSLSKRPHSVAPGRVFGVGYPCRVTKWGRRWSRAEGAVVPLVSPRCRPGTHAGCWDGVGWWEGAADPRREAGVRLASPGDASVLPGCGKDPLPAVASPQLQLVPAPRALCGPQGTLQPPSSQLGKLRLRADHTAQGPRASKGQI